MRSLLTQAEKEFRTDDRVLSVSLEESGGRSRLDVSMRLDKGAARPEKEVEKALEGSGAYMRTIRKSLYHEKEGFLESPFGTPAKEEQKL